MVFLAGALVLLVLPLLLLPCAIFAPGFPIAVACCRRSVFITCGSFRLVLFQRTSFPDVNSLLQPRQCQVFLAGSRSCIFSIREQSFNVIVPDEGGLCVSAVGSEGDAPASTHSVEHT